jgi:hypothetical protein
MAELRIPIIGEFKGKKAFDQAGGATSKLDKGVKKLAGTLAAAFSAQKIISFGKEAVKAFAENEKSAKRLETVVKNLGLAFELPGIEASLDKVSAKFGYEGEVLREAFQKLITTTGSAKKSQDLLNLSLEIAAGSGVDLLTVNQDLAAAYVGQTRGLRKYNLGLTQSELKTLDFDSAISKLSANFKGAGTAELETYAGKMRVLQEAADNAQEIIGKSLVESLSLLAGDNNTIEPLATAMADFATYIGDAIYGIAVLSEKIKGIPGFGGVANTASFRKLLSITPGGGLLSALDALAKLGSEARPTAGMGGYPSSALGPGYVDPNEAARKKAEAAAAKRAKELAALQKKILDTQKKSLAEAKKKAALDKASKTLNLEAIGIEAALKGKISETDRLSLQLQKAILEGNATLATQLSDQLEAAIKRNAQLQAALLATPKAPNPYEDWKIPSDLLAYTAASLGVSPETVINAPQTIPTQTTDATRELLDALLAAQAAQDKSEAAARAAESQSNIFVKVEVDGTEINSSAKTELTNQSLSGSFVNVNRLGRFANTPVAI